MGVKPLAAARQVRLQAAEEAGEAWILGDPDWLHQALVNVLGNAVRYTSPCGWFRSTVHSESGRVQIVIEDSGPGVRREVLSALGTRFYRPSTARERSTGGSGLGLAIVREVLHRHGGEVSFVCPEGVGLRVTLTLPETLNHRHPYL